jgi:hypothetical protein
MFKPYESTEAFRDAVRRIMNLDDEVIRSRAKGDLLRALGAFLCASTLRVALSIRALRPHAAVSTPASGPSKPVHPRTTL